MCKDIEIFIQRLIGVKNNELQHNIIIGLCLEMKQKLQYSKAERLRDLLKEAMQYSDIKGSNENGGQEAHINYEICAKDATMKQDALLATQK